MNVDFALNEEQEEVRRSVRAFAEAEVRPHVLAWDEASRFPAEIVPRLGAMGLLGMIVPEEYGGAGLGYLEYVAGDGVLRLISPVAEPPKALRLGAVRLEANHRAKRVDLRNLFGTE